MSGIATGGLLGAALLLAACMGPRESAGTGMFVFTYEGSTYAIISTDEAAGSGNVLLRRDRNRPFLRADDRNQDGTLDTLLAGDVLLAEADRIYAYGLAEAAAKGKRQERAPLHSYTVLLFGGTYTIQTGRDADDRFYNRFVVVAFGTSASVVALDVEADGRLERLERGTARLDTLQGRYAQLLRRGVQEGRIELRGPHYLVRPESIAVR